MEVTHYYLQMHSKCRNKCTGIYELDPAHCLSAPDLAWQEGLIRQIKLELLTNIDMLSMVEEGIRS